MAKCWTFNKCLCCIDLKVGSIVIAYAQLVVNLIGLITGLCVMIQAQNDVMDIATNIRQHPEHLKTLEESTTLLHNTMEVICLYLVSYSLIIIVMAAIGFDACLLYGIYKSKPTFVKSYLIFMAIFVGACILLWAISFAVPSIGLSIYITIPIIIAVYVYFLLVIRSFYYSMEIDYENTVPVKYSNKI